jgi:hypothetical protein
MTINCTNGGIAQDYSQEETRMTNLFNNQNQNDEGVVQMKGLQPNLGNTEVFSTDDRMSNMLYSPKMTRFSVQALMSMQKSHKKFAKEIMKSLYSKFPVYQKFSCDKGNKIDMVWTVGGNTPVVSLLSTEDEKRRLVVSTSENGFEFGVDTGKGERYQVVKDLISLSGKQNNAFMKNAIENNIWVKGDNIVEKGTEGATEFKVFVWSNSNERNVEAVFINAETFDGNKAFELIDKISGGSFTAKLKDAIAKNNGEMDFDTFAKLGTRLGILHTPALAMPVNAGADKGRIIFVDGDLEGPSDFGLDSEYMKAHGAEGSLFDFLNSKGIEIDRNTYDGAVYIALEFLAENFKAMGLSIPTWIVQTMAIQNRSEGLMSKVFGEAMRQEAMEAIHEYALSLLSAGKVKGVHTIGNDNDPIFMVIDTNGAKLPNMERILNPDGKGFKTYILNVAKASVSKTSGQMMSKFMALDAETTLAFVEEAAEYKAEEVVGRKFEQRKLTLKFDDNGVPQLEGSMVDKLIAANTDRAYVDRALNEQLAKDAAKWQDAAVRSGGVEIDTLYHHVLFDTTMMLSVGKIPYVLGFDKDLKAIQAFSLDVIANKAEEIAEIENNELLSNKEKKAALDVLLTAVVIKYPTPGREEYEVVRYQTKAEMLGLINVAVMKASATMTDETTTKLTKLLRRYFFETSFGVVKLAPLNILKNKLAGMDTDYDAICSIFEPVLVKLAVDRIHATGFNGSTVYISYDKDAKIERPLETVVINEEEIDGEENVGW